MSTHQTKNMLVTGGAGFIGSNFVRHVLAYMPTVKIINLDKLTYAGSMDNLCDLPNTSQHVFVQGDICDRQLVNELLAQHNIDTIVHFAAESHVDRSIDAPQTFIETNVLGTFTLLEAARQYWQQRRDVRFHHISTDEVYGSLQPSDPAFTETTAYDPRSPYSASKAGSDHLASAYFHTYDLPVTISNCSNNYGPFQHGEKLIPTIIRACITQQPIPVYGEGKNIRDWLYVEDHCAAIVKIIQEGRVGETYNIGGNNEWQNLELVKFICHEIDTLAPQDKPCAELISFVKDRPGHDFRYAIDDTKVASELNWQPQETLTTGIRKTIDFYLKSLSTQNA